MSALDYDCNLDLHEALQLLEMMFFTFEHAQTSQDWFTMREPIGSGIFAVERILRRAMKEVDAVATARAEGRVN